MEKINSLDAYPHHPKEHHPKPHENRILKIKMIPKTSKDETPSYTQLNGNQHENDKMPNHEKKKKKDIILNTTKWLSSPSTKE